MPDAIYDVYKLDYGCYVDLLTTQNAPRGLLPDDEAESGFAEPARRLEVNSKSDSRFI